MPRDRSLGRSRRSPRRQATSSDSSPSTIKNLKDKVLFLPSFNESPKGTTVAYLQEKYRHVQVVNLNASMYNVMHEHCYLKVLLQSIECITYMSVLLLSSFWIYYFDSYYIPGFVTFPASFFIWREWPNLQSKVWYQMVTKCIELTRNEIAAFKPTVVVGAGYGGAIAVFCLLENHYIKPTVLLAPMHAELNRLMVFDWHGSRKLPLNAKIVIAHGTKDMQVHINDSKNLAKDKKRCELHVLKNENHRMRTLVGKGKVATSNDELRLSDLIDRVLVMWKK